MAGDVGVDAPNNPWSSLIQLGMSEDANALPFRHARERWGESSSDARLQSSLSSIQQRLYTADQKRQEYLRAKAKAVRTVEPAENREERFRKLEEKLATADANRLTALESKRAKAKASLHRAEQAAERLAKRREALAAKMDTRVAAAESRRAERLAETAARLAVSHEAVLARVADLKREQSHAREVLGELVNVKLEQADAAREARLSAAAAKAAQEVAHAKAVSRGCRAAEEAAVAARAAALSDRLERASAWRREEAEAHGAACESGYLQRRSAIKRMLRRQHSSRKLQRAWRDFAQKHRTTAQLAADFVATGLTSLPPTTAERGSSPPRAQRAPRTPPRINTGNPGRTPFNTPADTPMPTPPATPTVGAAAAAAAVGRQGSGPLPAAAPPMAIMGVTTRLVGAGADAEPERDPFHQFAEAIQSPVTLKAAQALLKRIEAKVRAQGGEPDVSALVRRLFPKAARAGTPLPRYPARAFLSAYMVITHPQVVFNQQGEREAALTAASGAMVAAMDALLARMLASIPKKNSSSSRSGSSSSLESDFVGAAESVESRLADLLRRFDRAWVAHLEQFVAWKTADAASLEADLIKVAVDLEVSMLNKFAGAPPRSPAGSPQRMRSAEDLAAMVEQVARDHALLAERIERLGGAKGLARLEAALTAARADASMTSSPGSPTSSPRRPSPPEAAPAAPNTPPLAAPARAAPEGRSSSTENLGLVWELLYDANWQLSNSDVTAGWKDAIGETDVMKEGDSSMEDADPAAVAAAVQRRVKRIAERAFWDSVAENLATPGSAGTLEQLAALLGELGSELLAVLPDGSEPGASAGPAAGRVRALLDAGVLKQALASGSPESPVDTQQLLGVLEATAAVLREMGAPAREEAALAAHGAIRQQLTAALAAQDQALLGAALAKALRVLVAQLRLLKMDAANARLRALSLSMPPAAALEYARGKFAEAHGLSREEPGAAVAALPHTRAWLAMASGQVAQVEQALQGSLSGLQPPAGIPADSVPQNLRTGIRAASAAPSSEALAPRPAAQLVSPVQPRSWRGLVRLGLIGLVAGEAPAAGSGGLPETLRLDASRLHAGQNDFQQLLVLAAALLLLRQVAAERGSAAGMAPPVEAKRRMVALLADPGTRLAGLAAELAGLAGRAGAEGEAAMAAGLNRMLTRSGGAFKALCNGLVTALQLHLLCGDHSSPAQQAQLSQALARCGAEQLRPEVAALAARLRTVAAIGEAVHGATYDALSADLL